MKDSKTFKRFIERLEAEGILIRNKTKLALAIQCEVYNAIQDFLLQFDSRGKKQDFKDQCDENRTRHGLYLFSLGDQHLTDIGLDKDQRVANVNNSIGIIFHEEMEDAIIENQFKNAVYFYKLSNDPACGEMQAYYHENKEALFVGDCNEIRDILEDIHTHLKFEENIILPVGILLSKKEIKRVIVMLRSVKIRERNDTLRVRGPLLNKDKLQVSREVSAMSQSELKGIFRAVQNFKEFNHDNDPYGEHDCAIFNHKGDRFMFKIDYYDLELKGGIDPYSGEEYRAVMLIMFSHEY